MGVITQSAFDIARRRRTITVAGTVFGAAIALGALYCPRVFDVTYFRNGCGPSYGGCGNRDGPPWCLEDCKIVVFDRVVAEDTFPEEMGGALIRKWRLRVIAVLVLVGGGIGGVVGNLRFWSTGPPPRLRLWHWFLGPLLIFPALLAFGLSRTQQSLFVRVVAEWTTGDNAEPRVTGVDGGLEAFGLAVLASIVGWAGTLVVVAWRKLLPPWPPPEQAADYGEIDQPSQPREPTLRSDD
jgi:hypothetical protein